MILSEASILTRELMNHHGLSSWRFNYNRRKIGCGLCRYRYKTIELSIYYVQTALNDDIRDVILHEIAHALAFNKYGRSVHHGPEWREIALSIGCKANRLVENHELPDNYANYVGTCVCGWSIKRNRLREKVRIHGRCPKCISRFDRNQGQLTWKQI